MHHIMTSKQQQGSELSIPSHNQPITGHAQHSRSVDNMNHIMY
jgi:hypothetical protein